MSARHARITNKIHVDLLHKHAGLPTTLGVILTWIVQRTSLQTTRKPCTSFKPPPSCFTFTGNVGEDELDGQGAEHLIER